MENHISKKLLSPASLAVLLALVAIFTLMFPATVAVAFTSPTGAAPGGNIAAPVNVGTVNQVKNSNLGVNGLAVFGNSSASGNIFFSNGATRYLNFGVDLTDATTLINTSAANGYGIRDNAGIIEFKNSGGSYGSIQSIVNALIGGGASWTTSGNNIYNSNTGNVGIGTTNPIGTLSVENGAGTATICLNGVCSTSMGGGRQVMEVRYVTADNIDGPAMTTAYVTMPLTTVSNSTITGASLASNIITLPAGTYNIRATFRCIGISSTGSAKIRMWNNSTSALITTNTGRANMNGSYFLVPFDTIITLASPSGIRFDGRTDSSSLSCTFTDNFIDGYSETHTTVIIDKL